MSGHNKKSAPAEEEGGGESAPLWIISFADMISLLMAFFVMLSTFNTFDQKEKKKLQAVVDSAMLPLGGWFQKEPRNSFAPQYIDDNQTEGATKPTHEQPLKSRSLNQTESKDFKKFKVFNVPSSTMFVSTTAIITTEGKKWLDTMAQFLPKIPGGIVISEKGPNASPDASVNRAISVMTYLQEKGIDAGRFSISARGILSGTQYREQTVLEIGLLNQAVK